MATVEECRAALRKLAEQFDEVDEETKAKHVVDRSVSCHVPDLGAVFHGRIHHGGIEFRDPAPGERARDADIRLTISSDDLVALVDGELDMARALFGGRVKIEASIGDLFRLRRLL
ncbi:SCP2 sterol-binding domain-containing protein [Spongiactinospora sp. TRM90649]|uniref:SCP2 sterol-binding domain-containing protein n=1 Tax=Spongiactinospora sp. TRM90649 TaxID=3031114 RepID=UPI0023F7BEB2|nr:SCP2 sterol-binding domain-containing protein [Spongiactinospora sp. TRM90649]MDF5759231.1 SCP2 sterol-binding domain-containing protein [Spongiactinospora sp. TRM90649]